MNEPLPEHWERQLLETAQAFSYPPTPNLSGAVRRRLELRARRRVPLLRQRLAWATALVALLLSVLMAVPDVRAQILEFLQIGVIRIFQIEPTPSTTPTASLPARVPPDPTAGTPTGFPTRQPSPTPLTSLLNLAGETSLENAQRQAGFTLLLPAYPADLGQPDRVFLQHLNGEVVVLVWLDPGSPERIQLSLHLYSGAGNVTGEKVQPQVIQETTVDGHPAIWAEGPYVLKLSNGDMDIIRLIEGHVLIWQAGGVTYRLESDLDLEEALKIAESLQPGESPTP